MSPRQAQLVFPVALSGCALLALAAAIWAFLPIDVQTAAIPEGQASGPVTQPALTKIDNPVPTEAIVEAAARINLHRMGGGKKVELTNASEVTLPQFFRVTGTVIEPGRPRGSVGIFAFGLTDMKVAAVGEKVTDGIEVVEVRADSVILKVGDKQVEVKVEKKTEDTEAVPASSGGTP